MATAFSPQERTAITTKLLASAQRFASTVGMRRTTVDQLAHEAGISKGAFYSFFDSKEHLFFAMLEAVHEEMYGEAERILREDIHLPPAERAMQAVSQVCHSMEKNGILTFMQEEVPLLLRRLPQDIVQQHYHSDDEHIRRLIESAGIKLKTDIDTACAAVRIVVMSLMFKSSIGEHFGKAWNAVIEGVSRFLVVEP